MASTMFVTAGGEAHIAHVSSNAVTIDLLSSDGKLSASAVFSNPDSVKIDIDAMGANSRGDLFLTGGKIDRSGRPHILLIGTHDRLSRFSFATHPSEYSGDARATALTVDSWGDIYLTGRLPNDQGGTDLVLLKLAFEFNFQKTLGGAFYLRSRAKPNSLVALEATSDFVNWLPILTNRADEVGFVLFEDAEASTLPLRFYRTRTEQTDGM